MKIILAILLFFSFMLNCILIDDILTESPEERIKRINDSLIRDTLHKLKSYMDTCYIISPRNFPKKAQKGLKWD